MLDAQPEVPEVRPARWFDRFSDGMSAVGSCLVMVVMLIMDSDILGRFLFGRPVPGVPEIVVMSMGAIVFLQFPSALRTGRVIQTDSFLMLLKRRHPRAEAWLQALFCVVGIAIFALLFYAVWPLVERGVRLGDYYGNQGQFQFPKWPVGAIVLLGCLTMALQFAILGRMHLRRALGGAAAGGSA